MTGAQRDTRAAPFASLRERGHVVRSRPLRQVFDALDAAFEHETLPCVLIGAEGSGRASILEAYVRDAAEAGSLAVLIDAGTLRPGQVADDILAAFGQQPAPGSPSRLALQDFVEDCQFLRQRLIIAVPDIDDVDRAVAHELALLAELPVRGGAGAPLLLSARSEAAVAARGVKSIAVPLLDAGDTEALLREALSVSGAPLELGPGLAEELAALSGGLVGEVAERFDRAAISAASEGSPAIEVRHLATRAEASVSPTPDDIEKAILSLGAASDTEPEREPVRGPDVRLPTAGAYPTIASAGPGWQKPGPANDLTPAVSGHVVTALENMARDLADLQGRLAYVRSRAESLPELHRRRRLALTQASEHFVNSLRQTMRSAAEE